MSVLYAERIARKRHMCESCRSPIEPGTRYVRAALPPWTDPNESDHWWTLPVHGRKVEDCPMYGPPEGPRDPVLAELEWLR